MAIEEFLPFAINIDLNISICQCILLTRCVGEVRMPPEVTMKSQEKAEKPRKTFGLSLNRELMLEIQHLALDQDRYVNELLEEAARDLLKKYSDKRK